MDAAKSKKHDYSWTIFIFEGFEGPPKHQQIYKQITLKSMKTCIDDKMDVGMDVGRLLDRFLVDFGSRLEGKMEPSWH